MENQGPARLARALKSFSRALKSFSQGAVARKESGGGILPKRAGFEDMAARILKFGLESGGREIAAVNLFSGRMGEKALKGLHSMRWGASAGQIEAPAGRLLLQG
ncbi:MAG: hypothetical protein LBU32_16085 [Clostridiales bacterium]|nr:hypothetical protein [Clostridiales bacterium]